MSSVEAPPIYNPLIDNRGIATLPWVLFFSNIYTGDTGTVWTPTFTNLTTVGTPTITGKFYQFGQALAYFNVTITPGTSTSATAGTTYINNFPLVMSGNGACLAVSGLLGTNAGMCDKSSNNIYPPSWSAVTVPLTIVGMVEAS